MRKLALILVGAAGVLLGLGVLMAQPSEAPATRPGHQGKNAPPGFRHLIPPFAAEKMNLTDDQRKQLDDLAKEVQGKLEKILTPEQMKILQDARPPRGERGPADRGGKGGQGERGGHDGPPPPPEDGHDGPPPPPEE